MDDLSPPDLSVSLENLPARRVAFLVCRPEGDPDPIIRSHFDRVKEWAQRYGSDPATVPAIGIAEVADGRLQTYQCCIPIPDNAPVDHTEVGVQTLPGGMYAVLRIEKRSEVIGQAIGRFFQEVVPSAPWQIDQMRPTYEVYWADTMDFCVPACYANAKEA
jgi:DNA gyrase inhibitor GyrI